jgi:hypothetical protein
MNNNKNLNILDLVHDASRLICWIAHSEARYAAYAAVFKGRMNDGVLLNSARCQLYRVIQNLHQPMRGLKFNLALSKTFSGRIQPGFDFLGYRVNANGLIGLAQKLGITTAKPANDFTSQTRFVHINLTKTRKQKCKNKSTVKHIT